jgi:hypothetical protein
MAKGITSAREQVAVFHDESMRKGAPFAGYEDFDDCTAQNSDKDSPDAYCGEIKHRTEDKTAATDKPNRYVLLPHWDPQLAAEILHDHADAMGHPHQRLATPVADQGLVDLGRQGGFTLHDHVGDGPTSGYMVSRDKNTEQSMPIESLTPKLINDYVGKNNRALTDPNNYLGGWLDGKNFYLDVSHHRPTLDRAAADAVQAHQLAIYDLGHGTSINTPDAVNQAGDPGLAYVPKPPKNPFTSSLHDWTAHTLGDPGDEHLYADGYHYAADYDPAVMKSQGEHPGSTHGAIVHVNPTTQEKWLVKPDTKGGGALAKLDVAANHITAQSGLDSPATFETTHQGTPASAQLMWPETTNAYSKAIDPESITDADLPTIQKHHALDWMLGNHDAHGGQFIRNAQGKLIGIDKAQGFKFANNDRLHWNFHPNGPMYGESEPIYNTLYRNFAKGGRAMLDPRQGELGKYIQSLQDMPDAEYAATLRPYAETAAKNKILGKDFSATNKWNEVGWAKPKFKANDVDAFLAHAIERKNTLMKSMGDLHDRALAHRMTGTKIAKKTASAPDPVALTSMHKSLGSHGAKVYSDPQGQWLIKKPPPGAEFMPHLDKATADLQQQAGLTAPETHVLNWKNGQPVTAVKMLHGATQAYDEPPHLADVHPKHLETLQKHHVLDWLIGNHDGHVGNFVKLPPKNPADPADPGELVGIDKGQSLKYFGRDKLHWNFHPNFYAREPVYNNLWREYASGKPGEMGDPRQGEVGKFIDNLQAISDPHLKQMFRPYAEEAAEKGLLANVNDDGAGNVDPRRDLSAPTIPPNDPDAFLEALAKRKNSLKDHMGNLYDRAAASRHFAQNSMAMRDQFGKPHPLLDQPESEHGMHVVL